MENIEEKKNCFELLARGMHEMSAEYSKTIDSEVCKFLREKRI